jgi:hypothetical protein
LEFCFGEPELVFVLPWSIFPRDAHVIQHASYVNWMVTLAARVWVRRVEP